MKAWYFFLLCYVGDVNKNVQTFLAYLTLTNKQLGKYCVSFSFT